MSESGPDDRSDADKATSGEEVARPEQALPESADSSLTADSVAHKALGGSLGRVVEAGMSGEAVSATGVLEAIGGWRGVVESLLPATVYLVVFVITGDARLSAVAPLVIAAAAVAWRLARREPLTAALSGVLGVVICAAAVMFSGEGSSYFVPGFFINGAWILAHTISLLVGWPLIGLLLGVLRGSLTEWRQIPALRRTAALVTVFWIFVFAARLAVQLPLYFADETGSLGVARLVMGVPLFALAVLFTWLLLSRVSAMVGPPEGAPDDPNAGQESAK